MGVKVSITDKYRGDSVGAEAKKLIRNVCRAVLKEEGFGAAAQIDVTLVGDGEIRELNREFRDIDRATDVLSFPLGENGEYDINPENGAYMLGDVVISVDHAVAQAELYGHGLQREIAFLTAHSVLHLLGYDHVNGKEQERIMRKKEEDILCKIGLSVG